MDFHFKNLARFNRGVELGRQQMADEVEAVWNRNRGWIPGAARTELGEVLGRELKASQQLMRQALHWEHMDGTLCLGRIYPDDATNGQTGVCDDCDRRVRLVRPS